MSDHIKDIERDLEHAKAKKEELRQTLNDLYDEHIHWLTEVTRLTLKLAVAKKAKKLKDEVRHE